MKNYDKIKKENYTLANLIEILQILRAPDGCPWDRAQTHTSVIGNLIEECYEVVDAIECNSDDKLQEELGDVLMQVAFHVVLAEERKAFVMQDVINTLCNKLIYRHSFVFGEDSANSAYEALEFWEKNKKIEKKVSFFKKIELHMTYGVYTVEDKEIELRQMEDRAAMARKAAKNNIMTNILFYKEQFKVSLYNKKFIEENMRVAITDNQFLMYLQPKYSIIKNEIIGAEALVRWRHPERGMIYPDQFIPVIEENGFIRKVDYYIWAKACQFIKKCENIGITSCPVSVNVSRVHLQDNECIEVLSDLIESNHIPKSLLELEITETADNYQVSMKALELKEEGFTLLMDDFGSGYSSLNILLETPFDVIKLDKKFIENMMVSGKGKLILEQVVSMSNKLELGLLAEGVETKEQVELLQSIGCDQVQGYYYAKPMPEEEFFELLKKQYFN